MNIRNFCIISHIDHGKSTLADRFLEITKSVEAREMKEQILDNMDLERERGITIKLQPVRMNYESGGIKYELNLIDTPGHADFSYEVSRSLEAVEGAILLVDASQGVQAQTLATLDSAIKAGLVVIPVINKIDLPEARPEEVAFEIAELLKCDLQDIQFISAKTGEGVENLLKKVIELVPNPEIKIDAPPRALIFDSYFDDFRGVVIYIRVFEGEFKKHEGLHFVAQKTEGDISDLGEIKLGLKSLDCISAGEIGYIVTTLREVSQARVGDTVTISQKSKIRNQDGSVEFKTVKSEDSKKSWYDVEPLPGYKVPKSVVFAELYTTTGEDYNRLRDALMKLKLSDSSISYEPTSSGAFGFGFRLGFLGLLHLEIVKERLEREYDLDLIVTMPTVEHRLDNQGDYSEPYVKAELVLPKEYLGRVIDLLESKRGEQKDIRHLEEKVILDYELPLSEIVVDFYDRLKSVTSGYGSINYEIVDFRRSELVELNFLISGEKVDVFTRWVYKGFAQRIARRMVEKMKEFIPRQNFEVKIQAAIGGNIIASERIAPFRKDVTEKLYGGDVTRKRKLLEKQKKGKRRMAQVGRVQLPTDVFVKLLRY